MGLRDEDVGFTVKHLGFKTPSQGFGVRGCGFWVVVWDLDFSCYIREAILVTIYTHYGN